MTRAEFAARLKNACAAVPAAEAELTEIDSKFGDADHGLTMAKIAGAISEAVDAAEGGIQSMLDDAAMAVMTLNGGSAVPLWNTWLDGLQEEAPEGEEIDVAGLKAIFAKALEELEAAEAAAKKAALPAVEVEPQLTEKVDFDTFCKSDFRAVKVKACDAVKKSEKLLRFTLDDGTGVDRQILSGIHKWYEPEDLVGKTLIAIVNLPPRKMMGLESNGMLISAVHTEKGEEQLNLLMIDDKIPAGAKMC